MQSHVPGKEWIVELVKARAEPHRRQSESISGTMWSTLGWWVTGLYFLMGYVAAEYGGDPGTRAEIVAILIVVLVGLLAAVNRFAARPAGAVERWTARRYRRLLELILTDQVPVDVFRSHLDRIEKDYRDWDDLGVTGRYRRLRRERKDKPPLPPITDENALTFVDGEIGGPGDFLSW